MASITYLCTVEFRVKDAGRATQREPDQHFVYHNRDPQILADKLREHADKIPGYIRGIPAGCINWEHRNEEILTKLRGEYLNQVATILDSLTFAEEIE